MELIVGGRQVLEMQITPQNSESTFGPFRTNGVFVSFGRPFFCSDVKTNKARLSYIQSDMDFRMKIIIYKYSGPCRLGFSAG